MATPAAVLNIMVTANSQQARAELMKTEASLRKTAATAKSSTAATAATVGRGMARAATAVGVLGGASIAAAAKFEQAFAEVRKTVDTNEKGFQRIEKGLRNMAKEIPVAVTELSELAGEAGALGVKAKDIVAFTRVAADLGVTTNLSANEAADALARLANIMDTEGRKAFERMGSTLVDLGNKGASTEAEITEMALRIAGAGKTIGLTEAQVLGFASALANVGIRAEAGGSSISRVMLEMQDAVARGGSALNNFASIAGMSGGKFEQLFKTDAPAAIQAFVQGLDSVKDSGGSVIETLDKVNLNEIRVRDTLLRLGGATGEVTKAQQIANNAWGENSALAAEANKRYKTTISQFEILKNRVFDLGITFGQDLLPQVNEAMRALGEGRLDDAIKIMAELGGKMAARFAGAFGKAFLESDILGRLFLGGLLIRVLGGRGAFLALGKLIGSRVGVGLAIGLVLAGPQIIKEAYKLGQRIGEALKNSIPTIADIISGKTTDVADLATPREALKLGGLEAVINLYEEMGMSAKQAGKEAGELLEKVQDARLERGAERAAENIKRSNDKAGDSYKRHGERAQEASQTVEKASSNVSQSVGKHTSRAARDAQQNGAKMGKGISQPAFHAAKAVAAGMKNIAENVSESLSALAVKKSINFHIREPHEQRGPGMQTYQTGGVIVPGSGSGDKVPAMLEPGEVVLNKKAVAALGGAASANVINSIIPRFATGGIAGLQPGISRLVNWASERYGLRVSSGLRPGDSGSYHSKGWAADLVPPSMGATKGIFGAFRNQLAELFYDPWGGWDSGQMIGPIGGHMDHIHAAIIGSGSGGPMAARVKRQVLGGRGPLQAIGQAALDRVRKAANAYLRKNSMTSHGNIGNISGPLQAIAQRLVAAQWGRGQWPPFNELVMRESGWDPTAVNPSSGAAGLAQALPPSKYPAGAWPYTGKSSAVKQLQWMISYIAGRYGNPAGAIAFHNAHNWYQRGGIVGLAKGGIATGASGSLPKGLARTLKRLRQNTARLDEQLLIAETMGAMETGPGGSELTGGEKAQQLGILGALLGNLKTRASKVAYALAILPKGSKATGRLRDELTELQGITGGAGRILDTQAAIAALTGASTFGGDTSAQTDLLKEMLQQANLRYAVSQAQYGAFAGGGIAPPMVGGTPSPAAADVKIYHYGNGEFEAKVNGQTIDPRRIVEQGSRQMTRRRPLPSARGI